MKDANLIELGMTPNESKIYLILMRTGKTTAHDLILRSGLHKKVVYENLDRLIAKGLAYCVDEGGISRFSPGPISALVEHAQTKIDLAIAQKEKAEQATKALQEISKSQLSEQEVAVYKGIEGVRAFYRDVLAIGEEYMVYGGPGRSIELMGEHFWLNFNLKKNKAKVRARAVFNPSLRAYGDKIKGALTKVRYFSNAFEPQTETNIQGDRVGIIVWSDEPVVFVLTNKLAGASQHQFFEGMWKNAKE